MNLVIMVSFAYLQLLMLRLYRFSQKRKVHVGMKRREGEREGERKDGEREVERKVEEGRKNWLSCFAGCSIPAHPFESAFSLLRDASSCSSPSITPLTSRDTFTVMGVRGWSVRKEGSLL